MPNENCLEGMKCPSLPCGQEDKFIITSTARFMVHDDGTDSHENVEWDDDSDCSCGVCMWYGQVRDFKLGPDTEPQSIPSEIMQRLRSHMCRCTPKGFDVSYWEIAELPQGVVVQCIKCMTPLVLLAKRLEGE